MEKDPKSLPTCSAGNLSPPDEKGECAFMSTSCSFDGKHMCQAFFHLDGSEEKKDDTRPDLTDPTTTSLPSDDYLLSFHKEAEKVTKAKVASNCLHGNPRHATTTNMWQCTYDGYGLDENKKLTTSKQVWKGTLRSCDDGTSDDTIMQDVIKQAWMHAGGKEAKLDPKKFYCSITSIPN